VFVALMLALDLVVALYGVDSREWDQRDRRRWFPHERGRNGGDRGGRARRVPGRSGASVGNSSEPSHAAAAHYPIAGSVKNGVHGHQVPRVLAVVGARKTQIDPPCRTLGDCSLSTTVAKSHAHREGRSARADD
jgi:hypothetical protein